MLSDGELRRLAEIETLLRLDDPSLARRFDAGLRTHRRRPLLPLAAMIALAVSVAVLAIVCVMLVVIGS